MKGLMYIRAIWFNLGTRWHGSPWKLKRAIKKAKKLHEASHINPKKRKRYRVFFVGRKYRAMTRQDIQRQKHFGNWDWHVNATNMQPFCYFDTNTETPKFTEPCHS
jgi:hypothetical protein